MPAVVDKRPVLANVFIVRGNIGSLIRQDTEIDAVATGLWNNIQPGDRVAAIRQKKFSDLFDYGLHKVGKGKKNRGNQGVLVLARLLSSSAPLTWRRAALTWLLPKR
jgi:hypothetical protein